jgi:hypothetical protein
MSEYLNAFIHTPSEYIGKMVAVNKIEYVIGDFVSQGQEKIVHKLINKKSGICSHVIKIHRDLNNEYQHFYEFLGYKLYRHKGIPGQQIIIPDNKETTFHVQELVFYNREMNSELLAKGKNEFKEQNFERAYSIFMDILNNENQWNTEAMLGIFLSLSKKQDKIPSTEILLDILNIEPNSAYYLELFIIYAIKEGNKNISQLLTLSNIDVEPVVEEIAFKYDEMQCITQEMELELEKLLEERIVRFYTTIESKKVADLLRIEEDRIAFIDCFDDYKSSSNSKVLFQMSQIAEAYPQNKYYASICLSLLYDLPAFYEFIRLYEKTSDVLDSHFHEMAAESYINLGEPEMAKLISVKFSFNDAICNDIDIMLSNKNDFDKLSNQAIELALLGRLSEAFELQKKACNIFQFGFHSCFSNLLYYIYIKDIGNIQMPRIKNSVEFVYYYLHLLFHILICCDDTELWKVDKFLRDIYANLINLKENKISIPSRVLFCSNDKMIEYPYKEVVDLLKTYGEKRGVSNGLYYKILSFYEKEASIQNEETKT